MSELALVTAAGGFVATSLVGNIIGGMMLIATLNYAQVVSGEGDQEISISRPGL
jgi:formate/nitrite transporter FocA (FNT family)